MAKLSLLFFAAIVLFDSVMPALPRNKWRARRRGMEESPKRRYVDNGIGESDEHAGGHCPLRGKDTYSRGSRRIIGGIKATGHFPSMVSIRRNKGHICGGSVVHEHWILTSAYCIEIMQGIFINIRVVVGTIYLNSWDGVEYLVKHAHSLPTYNSSLLKDDIGLIEIEDRISVPPIKLSSERAPSGVSVTLCGWGFTWFPGDKFPSTLQCVNLTTISNMECRGRWRGLKDIFDTHICTKPRRGQGICYGDEGSPLVHGYTQIGIVSFGYPCGKGYPDVYTRVSPYVDYIESLWH